MYYFISPFHCFMFFLALVLNALLTRVRFPAFKRAKDSIYQILEIDCFMYQ